MKLDPFNKQIETGMNRANKFMIFQVNNKYEHHELNNIEQYCIVYWCIVHQRFIGLLKLGNAKNNLMLVHASIGMKSC